MSSGEAHSLKCRPETSMSVAATQRASPRRNTAQSSPMGTMTSGGGAGRRAEKRRMMSNSFNSVFAERTVGGKEPAVLKEHFCPGQDFISLTASHRTSDSSSVYQVFRSYHSSS